MINTIRSSKYIKASLLLNALMLVMSFISVAFYRFFNETTWSVFIIIGGIVIVLFFVSIVGSLVYVFIGKVSLRFRFIPLIANILMFILFPAVQQIVLLNNNDYANERYIYDTLKRAGVTMEAPPTEYATEFARTVIEGLTTSKEISLLTTEDAVPGEYQSIFFNYGDRGTLLSLQKYYDQRLGHSISVNVDIERKDNIRLRHKINIGTDYSNWELIKKETSYPNEPFVRKYVLVQRRGEDGRMVGLSYYEGSVAKIEYEGLVDDNAITNLVDVTWKIAERHEQVYDTYLRKISEGPLFANNPTITRPDLPDPDLEN